MKKKNKSFAALLVSVLVLAGTVVLPLFAKAGFFTDMKDKSLIKAVDEGNNAKIQQLAAAPGVDLDAALCEAISKRGNYYGNYNEIDSEIFSMIKILVAQGADKNHSTKCGTYDDSVAYYALRMGAVNVSQFFLSQGDSLSAPEDWYKHVNTEDYQLAVTHGAPVPTTDDAMNEYVYSNGLDSDGRFKALVAVGAPITEKALTTMAYVGDIDSVRFMQSRLKVVPGWSAENALFRSKNAQTADARKAIALIYLPLVADVNKSYDTDGQTLLHVASCNGQIANVQLLMGRGANPNKAANNDTTALMCAASYGYVNVVQYLLQHGADKRLRDEKGNTAMEWICASYPRTNESTTNSQFSADGARVGMGFGVESDVSGESSSETKYQTNVNRIDCNRRALRAVLSGARMVAAAPAGPPPASAGPSRIPGSLSFPTSAPAFDGQ